ncbi:MAG: diguanylate cyclase [Caulobacteraceae bacterium]|nr:diguanylate cyclase [Caulobacteraceae bacterium]
MSSGVESTLRGPNAYGLARKVLEDMERRQIWPTALNYELWLHFMANPDGDLAQEIERLLQAGETITEGLSEQLAAAYLPKARLNEQIRDAGDQLNKELAAVAQAIKQAQRSSEQYGQTLAGAGRTLAEDAEPAVLKRLIDTLTTATKRVQRENKALEKRLDESTAEVGRLREHLEQVRRDATTDALTNLANRKAFDDELGRACAEATDKSEPLTLAVIDIDHFKRFNDTWGHQTGDQVIRYVSSVIGRMAPPPRFAARYGGEEFAMIFPGERVAEVFHTLEEIRLEVSSRTLKRRSTNEDLGTITVSAGLAQFKFGERMEALIERADEALYTSKRGGRNMVTTAGEPAAAAA